MTCYLLKHVGSRSSIQVSIYYLHDDPECCLKFCISFCTERHFFMLRTMYVVDIFCPACRRTRSLLLTASPCLRCKWMLLLQWPWHPCCLPPMCADCNDLRNLVRSACCQECYHNQQIGCCQLYEQLSQGDHGGASPPGASPPSWTPNILNEK